MNIRKAEHTDLEQILPIYAYAREQMALNGNPGQWGTDKPEPETIRQDITQGRLFLIEADPPASSLSQAEPFRRNASENLPEAFNWNVSEPPAETFRRNASENLAETFCQAISNRQIAGVFAFQIGEEPTYQEIQGRWLNELPYGVIHRIASSGGQKGILAECLKFCNAFTRNLRIDTHEDNLIMRHLLKKNGFLECGIIHVEDGSPRIAFQRLRK